MLATRKGTAVTWWHVDALGSPVATTNASGAVVERQQYEPYGAALGGATDGVGYTGHVMDAVTGLTYMQQRYMDPGLGVFLSVDPVTAYTNPVGAFNRYWYANNNPYKLFDPDGRLSDDPNRQHRGGHSVNQASPEADRINYEKGGAPTAKLSAQMRSRDAGGRLSAAKTAMTVSRIDGDPNALSYNQDLGAASATTDVFGSVELGPDAFVSWSWLSSTLGHEFEVHVPQFKSLGGLRGQRDSDYREVQAHQYNLDNAARFRNSPEEIERHRDLRSRYQHRLDGGR